MESGLAKSWIVLPEFECGFSIDREIGNQNAAILALFQGAYPNTQTLDPMTQTPSPNTANIQTPNTPKPSKHQNNLSTAPEAVELIRHTHHSQGQIMALTWPHFLSRRP